MRNAIETGVSALNPAPVNATEGEAAAIAPRVPTAAEQAATDAENAADQAEIEAAENLSDYAGNVAARSAVVSDRSTFKAILAASLSMALASAPRTMRGQPASPDMDTFAFNGILASMASRGVLIWRNAADTRDSEVALSDALAQSDAAARTKAIAQYVNGFGTGRKLADGPANLKTNADRLASLFRDNPEGRAVIGDMFAMRDNLASVIPAWREHVVTVTGCTGSDALASYLRSIYGRPSVKGSTKARKAVAAAGIPLSAPSVDAVPATIPAQVEPEVRTFTTVVAPDYAAMPEADRVAAILAIADTLGDDGLESLYQRIAAERDARREARQSAELDRMRLEAEQAGADAAAKAERVLAVEVALAA